MRLTIKHNCRSLRVIAPVRCGLSDGVEYLVDDRSGVVAGERPVGDEAPVEGGAGEAVDGDTEVGG